MDALNATWRSATCRVLVAATGARSANAGPVHFDIPLREPLVPDPDPGPTPHGRPNGRPWTYTASPGMWRTEPIACKEPILN
jgi:2-succinyl-5-enolpyruvyl-6-hydroxy-3-cyclohexene-1-carboxylate synthase